MISVRTCVAVLLPLLWTTAAWGQRPTQEVAQNGNGRIEARPLLDRPARLTVEDVSLEKALLALTRSSGVPLAFSPARLPVHVRATCRCEELTVREAMQHLLAGTSFEYLELAGQLVLFPATLHREIGPRDLEPRGHWRLAADNSAAMPRLGRAAPIIPRQRQGSITGTVRDGNTLQPIAGARVALPDLGSGALTQSNGRYVIIDVPVGTHRIEVQVIGYRAGSQEVTVPVGGAVQADFDLAVDALRLGELVVTGTPGRARAREVGNSIAQIDRADAIDVPVSMESMLQAQVPGMTVLQSTSQLGSAAQIRLRGNISAAMSNQPLIYIDGVRMRSEPYPKNITPGDSDTRSPNDVHSPLNDLNPADIERMEVIRGAAASTLYGTEAAAGVIQIFTKRGRTERPVWSLEVNQGFQELKPFAPEPAPYMYLDPWLRKGRQQQFNASVQGGGQTLNYFISGSLEDRKGVLPNERLEGTTFRGNFGFSPMGGLDLTWTNFYSTTEIQNTSQGNNSGGLVMNVYRQEQNHFSTTDVDELSRFLEYELLSNIDRMNTGITATYAPMANWFHRFTVGYDLAHNEMRQVRPFGYIAEPLGRVGVTAFRGALTTVDYASTLDLQIAPEVRNSFSVGGQFVQTAEHVVRGGSTNFPGPSLPTLSTGSIKVSEEDRIRVLTGGFFVQNVVGFRDRYFITGGLRVDGNSAFGSGFGLQGYPKVAVSYVVHEERFWRDAWGQLKLRGAYGHAGRAPGAFDAIRTWDPVGWGDVPAYVPQNLGNADLGPERSVETEVGFDASILDGRVMANFTYYQANTKDALFRVRASPSEGFLAPQLRNVGQIENKGIELELNLRLLEGERANLSLGTSLATNHSKVLDLGGAVPFSLGGSTWVVEGQPIMVVRGVKLNNPEEIADPDVELDHFFGPNHPTLIIGVMPSLELPGRIKVSARGEYQGGHFIRDGPTQNASSRSIESWPTCMNARRLLSEDRGDELTALERLRCDGRHYQNDTHIYPSDFFKVRDVTVRFPVPFRIPTTSSAFVSVSAHNWFRWLNKEFPIFDPEMMGNFGAAQQARFMTEQTPPPATITASLRIVL